MAKKGQTFQHYPESVKRWVRVYQEQGEKVFEARRGNPHRVQTEESRTIKHMEMVNTVPNETAGR